MRSRGLGAPPSLIVATARVMGATRLAVDGRIVDAKLVPALS